MSSNRFFLLPALGFFISLSACAGKPVNKKIEFGPQYWQRMSTSDAIYTRGPKAQQILNRDIARCVNDIKELERLGSIKGGLPATGVKDRILDPNAPQVQRYNMDQRDGYLLMEHGQYYDFESCMITKGWERVLHVPYDVSKEARSTYLKSHVDYKYQSRIESRQPYKATPNNDRHYGDLNK